MKKRPSIMIVEDEAIIVLLMKKKLKEAGFISVSSFADGDEAIKEVANIKPDFVIMDINLAGSKDGIETAEIINKATSTKFIFITGYHIDNIEKKISKLKPLITLNKPLDINKIIEKINTNYKEKK